jgi:hypothetical protein
MVFCEPKVLRFVKEIWIPHATVGFRTSLPRHRRKHRRIHQRLEALVVGLEMND